MSGNSEKFYSLIKQSKAYAQLVADYDSARLSHAYAIISPDADASSLLVKAFLSYIYGKSDAAAEHRIFTDGYLDVLWFPKITDDKKAKLSVADIEYLMQTAYVLPAELDYKWIILCADEPISETVQNKLLKTLEEPPSRTRFIICARGAGELLPTVNSRARSVMMDEFSAKDILEVLLAHYPDKKQECEIAATYCSGRVMLAEKMTQNPAYVEAYDKAMDILLNVQRSAQIFPYATGLTLSKDLFLITADFMQAILRDAQSVLCGCAHLVGVKSRMSDIEKIASDFTLESIIKIMPCFERVKRRMRLYGNLPSVVDELLFSVLEVKAQCKK